MSIFDQTIVTEDSGMCNSTSYYTLDNIYIAFEKRQQDKLRQDKNAKLCQQGMPGWICPRCGRGNAPFSSACPGVPMLTPVITCSTMSD